MKKILCTLLMIVMLFSFCSCKDSKATTDNEYKSESSDGVEEFMSILNDFEPSGLIDGCKIEKENCFNVTPPQVASETDMKIFKFSDSCASYVMLDNEIYTLCEWFGGFGFVNAVPCDFDNDGNKDLLVASSSGSGIHRSAISVFNSVTKESSYVFCTTDIDLIVATSTSANSQEENESQTDCYRVYSADIIVNDEVDYGLADLSYEPNEIVGSIENKNGVPTFISYQE